MKKVIIFGISDVAELSHFYFTTDSIYEVVAFCVDSAYLPALPEFCGLPVVSYENVVDEYPPGRFAFFVALGYSRLNQNRKERYLAVKELGYELVSYISTKATILNDHKIGENCFILEGNIIQPFVSIGSNVIMWSGNHIGHHTRIGNHCFFASHIVVSGRVQIGESCFIGVNATFRDHISIGDKCIIGAGTLILSDISAEGVYVGKEADRSRVPSGRVKNI